MVTDDSSVRFGLQVDAGLAFCEHCDVRAAVIIENVLGPDSPEITQVWYYWAQVKSKAGKFPEALNYSRLASSAVVDRITSLFPGDDQTKQTWRLSKTPTFSVCILAIWRKIARHDDKSSEAVGGEAFEMAQWRLQSSAAAV